MRDERPFRWRDPITGHWNFRTMKASELIEMLQITIDAHGDLPMALCDAQEADIHSVSVRDGTIYVSS